MIQKLLTALGALLGGILLIGCEAAPPPPRVDDLAFPVLVIYPHAGYEDFPSAESLNSMNTQRILHYRDVPLLIDSTLRVYQLKDLKSTKSGLALMASAGTGRTPVSYTLGRTTQSGVATVREIVLRECSPMTVGIDAERRRELLATAESLQEILAAVDGEL